MMREQMNDEKHYEKMLNLVGGFDLSYKGDREILDTLNEGMVELSYKWFKATDEKFPKDLSLEDYKKYTEECSKILEKDNEDHI